MLIQNEIPIIQKTYDFYGELYLAIEKMPKKDKYSLGKKMEETTLELLELLIIASHADKQRKVLILERVDAKQEILKMLVRLSEEIKAISTKKYLSLQKRLQEIGRMLGGWMKSTKI